MVVGMRSAQHWVASSTPSDAEDAGITVAMLGSVDMLPHCRGHLSSVGLSNEGGIRSKNSEESFKVPDRAA